MVVAEPCIPTVRPSPSGYSSLEPRGFSGLTAGAGRCAFEPLGSKLPLRTLRAIDPNLGGLIAGEVGPPAFSVVSTSNQLALDTDEGDLDNRVSH